MLIKKKNVYVIILKLITCWDINQVTSIFQMNFLDNHCKNRLKQKKRTPTRNFAQSDYSGLQISASVHNFGFLKQFAIKGSIVKKIKRVNITIEFFIFELGYVLNFS